MTRRPRIIAIVNRKGGVGKTTTTVNLGCALAAAGQRVLLIDADSQGNASTGLGLGRQQRQPGTETLLDEPLPIGRLARPTVVPGLEVVPAGPGLAGLELDLAGEERREFRLMDGLAFALKSATKPYDLVLIDCPPSLGLLTLNALVAADGALIPVQCEFFPLEGLSEVLNTLDLARRAFNPRLKLEGVVLTMFDRRNTLSDQVAHDVRAHLGPAVFQTVIPRNVRVAEAPSHGLPVLLYDHRSPGAQAYVALARELQQRLKPAPTAAE